MNALRKVYTPVGIVFKGSGFYATDHRSPSGTRSKTEHGHESESKSKEAESSTSGEKSDKDNISSSSETKKPVKSND